MGLILKVHTLRKKRKHVCGRYNNKQGKSRAKEDAEDATYLLCSELNYFLFLGKSHLLPRKYLLQGQI